MAQIKITRVEHYVDVTAETLPTIKRRFRDVKNCWVEVVGKYDVEIVRVPKSAILSMLAGGHESGFTINFHQDGDATLYASK